jgi:TPR repeat protein
MDEPPAAALKSPCCVCAEPGGKHCTECKSRNYCSKKCQLVDWNDGHKSACKQLAVKFQDRLLDTLMPAKKIKEEPPIVEGVAPAAGLKAAARLPAAPTQTTALVKATAVHGDAPDWRGTCAICCDLLPVDHGQQTLYSCCCKRLCTACSDKCQQYDERCPLCRTPVPSEAEWLRRMQKHVDEGNAEAQLALGATFELGDMGLKQSHKRAFQLYQLAAAQEVH